VWGIRTMLPLTPRDQANEPPSLRLYFYFPSAVVDQCDRHDNLDKVSHGVFCTYMSSFVCCSGRGGRSGSRALRKSSVSFPIVVQARCMLNDCIVVFCLMASMSPRCIPSTEARTERLSFGRSSVKQCLSPQIGIGQP
jgi:hypothetical protein